LANEVINVRKDGTGRPEERTVEKVEEREERVKDVTSTISSVVTLEEEGE